jgi:hypothetical protein
LTVELSSGVSAEADDVADDTDEGKTIDEETDEDDKNNNKNQPIVAQASDTLHRTPTAIIFFLRSSTANRGSHEAQKTWLSGVAGKIRSR